MLLTITLILVAMLALAALELWLFWRLGEREGRLRTRRTRDLGSSTARTGASGVGPRRRGASTARPAA